MAETNVKTGNQLPISVTAIISLIVGAIALLTSLIPIVNNGSFFFAFAGIILGIVGLVGILKKKKRSKVLVIIALAINVIAVIAVLASQSFYGQALNEVSNPTSSKTKGASEAKVGESLTLNNDLEITVVSVEGGLTNYDGTAVTKVVVKYINNGKSEVSYNSFDWKAENSQGAQTSTTIYSGGGLGSNSDALSSGKLAAGGTVTGTLYFKGDVVKMLYSSSLISNTTAT